MTRHHVLTLLVDVMQTGLCTSNISMYTILMLKLDGGLKEFPAKVLLDCSPVAEFLRAMDHDRPTQKRFVDRRLIITGRDGTEDYYFLSRVTVIGKDDE
ncbi:hypothetical protein TNCV_5060171 [Trichonephila clavipes]|nr:hypothetical protein TNCV_5060171 [Trichonephila clavipes]